MKDLKALVYLSFWVAGMVLAKGFWSTLFAICLPPWGWYLIAERALTVSGLI